MLLVRVKSVSAMLILFVVWKCFRTLGSEVEAQMKNEETNIQWETSLKQLLENLGNEAKKEMTSEMNRESLHHLGRDFRDRRGRSRDKKKEKDSASSPDLKRKGKKAAKSRSRSARSRHGRERARSSKVIQFNERMLLEVKVFGCTIILFSF